MQNTPTLFRVILPVPNIVQAAAFYGDALGIHGERVSPGRHSFQYLYFAVSNLEATRARVPTAGGTIDADIETMPGGERLFYARDPFGSRISFVDERTCFTGRQA
ncbi:MAG TPA: VOC family protein [Verrucomicrobiae bacterium]|nr:VOC family protein [Verrucomicrobiae bacterium]